MNASVTVPTVSGDQLTEICARAGYHSSFPKPALYDQPIVEGRFDCVEYPDGLSVHISEMTELSDTTNSAVLSPRLSFIVLIEGELRFALDERQFHLVSKPFEACCAALILDSSKVLHRILKRGARVKKVNVTVTHEWLHKHCPDMMADVGNLALGAQNDLPIWRGSFAILSAATRILEPSSKARHLQKLDIENLALSIVGEGLAALHDLAPGANQGSRRTRQVAEVQAYLNTRLAEPLDIGEVGSIFGMSLSTLQRYFKKATGMTVGEYVRIQRLILARQQLEEGHVSISEAAFTAGYTHPTNFITAYKKIFGYNPGDCMKQSEL